MNVETKSCFAEILNNYPIKNAVSIKKAKMILQNVQMQLDRLKNKGETIFSEHKKDWNPHKTQFEEIENKLKLLENPLRIEDPVNLLLELENIRKSNTDELEKLKKTIEGNEAFFNEIDKIDIPKFLKEKENEISGNKEIHSFFEKTLKKIEKLRKNIEIHNIGLNFTEVMKNMASNCTDRISKLISKDLVSAESEKSSIPKNDQRMTTLKDLKNSWLDALTSSITLKESIYRNLVDCVISPKMKEFEINILENKIYFNDLIKYLKKISVQELSSGFHHEYDENTKNGIETDNEYLINADLQFNQPNESNYPKKRFKRDFSKFFENARKYKQLKENFLEKQEDLKILRLNIDSFFQTMLEKLSPISTRINQLENGEAHVSDFHSTDKEIAKLLGQLDKDEINNLKQLIIKHENSWNQYQKDLLQLEHQSEIFTQFSNTYENLTLAYFLAEEIHGELRQARKEEDNQQVHIYLEKSMRQEYKILSNLLGQTCEMDQENKNINLTSHSLPFNELLKIFKENPQNLPNQPKNDSLPVLSFVLINDCQQIHELTIPNTCKIYDNNLYNQMTSFNIFKETIDENAKQYQAELENKFKKYQANVTSAFKTTLKDICEHVVFGLNQQIKAVYHYGENSSYAHCFNQAFFAKNVVGRATQTVGTYVAYGLSKALQMLPLQQTSHFVEEDINDNSADDDVEPYNENKELSKKMDYITSPFATMKITF